MVSRLFEILDGAENCSYVLSIKQFGPISVYMYVQELKVDLVFYF